MTERSLQVTYRKGRTFAAYLHLSHPTGEKSARTVVSADGLLIVDYAASGRPFGVEITAPQAVPLDRAHGANVGAHRSLRSTEGVTSAVRQEPTPVGLARLLTLTLTTGRRPPAS